MTKMTKAEREAWETLRDTLAGCGMPPFTDEVVGNARGLCDCVLMMEWDRIIDTETRQAMKKRIAGALGPHKVWLFNPDSVLPRIKWINNLLGETA